MGFWIAALGVAVVLFALAWWTSGRSKPLDGRFGRPLTPRQTLRLDATKYGTHEQKGINNPYG
jgi:hypothetical protein